MNLAPTYYDFVFKLRPFLVNIVSQDVQDLQASANPPETIGSVDSYNSRFSQCITEVENDLIEKTASLRGISVESLRRSFESEKQRNKSYFMSLYQTINLEYHCLLNFIMSGKKTFYFSDNLSEHLANTEINLKASLIHLPFPSCMFVFTSRDAINALHNIRRREGRWDMNTANLDYSAPVSVFITMHPAGEGLPGHKLLICAFHAKPPEKSYLGTKREIYLGENWSLEQALRTDWEKLNPSNCGDGMSLSIDDENIRPQDDDIFYTDGLAFYRIILNAVLYLSSDNAERTSKISPRVEIEAKANEITSRPKRKKLVQSMGRYSALNYDEVGGSIGPIVIQKGEDGEEHNTSKSGNSKVMVRFMVRGHWRQQPFGPASQDRKLIRIQPYWKGPDLADKINKPYLVK